MRVVKEIGQLLLWCAVGGYIGYSAGYMYDGHIFNKYLESEGIMETMCSKPLPQIKERIVVNECVNYLSNRENKIGDDMVGGK